MVSSVLVVDDDEAIRSSFRRILEKHGYEVTEGPDGQTALPPPSNWYWSRMDPRRHPTSG